MFLIKGLFITLDDGEKNILNGCSYISYIYYIQNGDITFQRRYRPETIDNKYYIETLMIYLILNYANESPDNIND